MQQAVTGLWRFCVCSRDRQKCVSEQNGGLATELARRLFVGKAKQFYVLKLTRTCAKITG